MIEAVHGEPRVGNAFPAFEAAFADDRRETRFIWFAADALSVKNFAMEKGPTDAKPDLREKYPCGRPDNPAIHCFGRLFSPLVTHG